MKGTIDIKKLEEEIKDVRAKLEAAASVVMEKGKSLGEDENILRQSRYLDELILTEQHIRMAQKSQEENEQ